MTQCDLTFLQQWLRSGAWISAEKGWLWLGWGKRTRQKEPSLNSFFAPDFFLKDPAPFWCFEHTEKQSVSAVKGALQTYLAGQPSPEALPWSQSSHADFQSAFRDLQNSFRAGSLKKAVPVISDRANWPETDPMARQAYWMLGAVNYSESASVYLYGAWADSDGLLGATPELLIEGQADGQNARWSTVALAGTRRDSERSERLPLTEDPKELREHRLVIEGIQSSLRTFGEVQVGETHELRLPGLSHLKTPITLQARGDHFALRDLVSALHPTPALGTSPRDAFQSVLSELDQKLGTDRKRFGAPFGFSGGFSRAVVAIRNLQWDRQGITVSAGCGVIAESDAEREWQELQAKIAAAKRIFLT